jgi:hypothetical protein
LLLAFGINFPGELSHFFRERLYRNGFENRVQVISSFLRRLKSLRSIQSVLKFHHGNGRDHEFCLSVLGTKSFEQDADRRCLTFRRNQAVESKTNPIAGD